MRAGLLRHRVSIGTPSQTNNDDGTVSLSWETTARWASIEPLRGREFLMAQQLDSVADHRIRFRHLSTVTRKSRITLGARTFNIVSIENADERDIMDTVLAKEDV